MLTTFFLIGHHIKTPLIGYNSIWHNEKKTLVNTLPYGTQKYSALNPSAAELAAGRKK
jgi:hypothetical protein